MTRELNQKWGSGQPGTSLDVSVCSGHQAVLLQHRRQRLRASETELGLCGCLHWGAECLIQCPWQAVQMIGTCGLKEASKGLTQIPLGFTPG